MRGSCVKCRSPMSMGKDLCDGGKVREGLLVTIAMAMRS
jgi:hypothetical protein